MAEKVLLIGLATDGESNRVFLPSSLEEVKNLYGWNYGQRNSITTIGTSLILNYTPLDKVSNTVDGLKQYLYHPYIIDTTMFFGSIGGSGNHVVDLYYTPYLGKEDLITACMHYYEQRGEFPYVARIGGTKARYNIDNWIFEARYPGAKYNSVVVAFTGSSLSVSGMEPIYNGFTINSSGVSLVAQLEEKYKLGTSPIYITQYQENLSSFTASLTGGTDGIFSDTEIDNFFDIIDLPAAVSHVVLLTPLTSGIVSSVSNYLSNTDSQPRLFLTSTTSVTNPASTWAYETFSSIPYRSNFITAMVGNVTSPIYGRERERYAVESLAISFNQSGNSNITNLPLDAVYFNPTLSSYELRFLKLCGFVAPVRHIRNNISVFEGVTTANQNSFLYSSKAAEIGAIAYNYCTQFIGKRLTTGFNAEMSKELGGLLSSVKFISLDTVSVTLTTETIIVSIEAFLPDEILSISFGIKNRLNSSI